MRRYLTSLVLALAATGGAATAQDVWDDEGGIETEAGAEAAIVLAPDSDESVLYTLRGGFGANYVLQNGAEIGLRLSGGVDMDHPARPGFSGNIGPADPTQSPAGAFIGLAHGPSALDAGPRGRLETGYIYIDGGYGEARLGLDDGVAARFFEGAPSLFRHSGLANPALDPSGQALARTDHDLTGPSFKVSYATPRILGVRAGVSVTPEASASGLDRDPVGGPAHPDIENAVEAALSVTRRLPRSGVRLRAAAAYSEADASSAAAPAAFDKVETWSTGGSLEFSWGALGASYLSSNNGFALTGSDYSALSAALRMTFGDLDTGLEIANAEDEALGAESEAVGISLARAFGKNLRIAGGWRWLDTRYTGNALPAPPSLRDRTDGIVIEITLSR
jgi:hypothetical protein